MDRNMASGGVLVHKTPHEARELIASMLTNLQQFGSKPMVTRSVNKAYIASIEQQEIKNNL